MRFVFKRAFIHLDAVRERKAPVAMHGIFEFGHIHSFAFKLRIRIRRVGHYFSHLKSVLNKHHCISARIVAPIRIYVAKLLKLDVVHDASIDNQISDIAFRVNSLAHSHGKQSIALLGYIRRKRVRDGRLYKNSKHSH